MSAHSFDPDIAARVGCNAAVIYQNLFYWAEKNAANGRHFYEGRWWTYNSVSAFADLFPYLTGKQIRTALDKLESDGLIVSGCYNKSAYDRTKWYSPTCLKAETHLPKKTNENDQKGEPIPDINTNHKPVNYINRDLPHWLPLEAWNGWLDMRNKLKKPPTNRAIELALDKLEAMQQKGQDITEVLDRSTINGWTDLYEIKEQKNGTTNRTTGKPRNENGFAAALRYVADGRSDEPF
jgi:hypothetical protein